MLCQLDLILYRGTFIRQSTLLIAYYGNMLHKYRMLTSCHCRFLHGGLILSDTYTKHTDVTLFYSVRARCAIKLEINYFCRIKYAFAKFTLSNWLMCSILVYSFFWIFVSQDKSPEFRVEPIMVTKISDKMT